MPVDNGKNDGYDFVTRTVLFLENTYGIRFFITPKDFDVLYRWYEKRIPFPIVRESIGNVVERWKEKNKTVYSFSNFSYEVKKNFKTFLQLNVGASVDVVRDKPETGEFAEAEHFFEHFPPGLVTLKQDFEEIFRQVKNKEAIEPAPVYRKLVELFNDDEELNIKAAVFLRGLAPELRKPEIENRYRLNYLLNKYRIPDFEMLT